MGQPNPQINVPVQSSVCACAKTCICNTAKRKKIRWVNTDDVTMTESVRVNLLRLKRSHVHPEQWFSNFSAISHQKDKKNKSSIPPILKVYSTIVILKKK